MPFARGQVKLHLGQLDLGLGDVGAVGFDDFLDQGLKRGKGVKHAADDGQDDHAGTDKKPAFHGLTLLVRCSRPASIRAGYIGHCAPTKYNPSKAI
jgi:hypothetical protein